MAACDLRRQRTFGGEGAVDVRLLAGDGLQQILRALERQLGIAVLRFELRDIGLVVLDLRLKRRLLELVEKIALFDLGALDKQPLFEKRADPGYQRDPPDRLDAPDELVGLCDLLALGAHDADRWRPARRGLSVGPDRGARPRSEVGGRPS